MEALVMVCDGRPCPNTMNLRLLQVLMNYGLRKVRCVREQINIWERKIWLLPGNVYKYKHIHIFMHVYIQFLLL